MEKTAIVTGASGGIGSACSKLLAQDHDICLQYYTNEESARSIANEIRNEEEYEGDVFIFPCDVTNPTDINHLVRESNKRFGVIDVLINTVGTFPATEVTQSSTTELDQTIAVNLLSSIYTTRAVLPDMLSQSKGWIVNVTSVAGVEGSWHDPVYGAAKAGVTGFTQSLDKAYSEHGIYSNVVAPTATDTDMLPDWIEPTTEMSSSKKRVLHPLEVAEAVQFFATTTCISGKVLEVSTADHM